MPSGVRGGNTPGHGSRQKVDPAVVVLGQRALVDVPSLGIAAAALAVVVLTRRVPEPAVIAAAGVVGIVARG